MRSDDFTVTVSNGTGLVHRGEGAVVLLPAPAPAQAVAAAAVLAACSGAADPTGRRAVRAVAAVLAATDPAETPPFAAAFGTDAGLVLLVHGEAQADVDGTVRLRGTDSLAWVERAFTGDVRQVALTVPGAAAWLRPEPATAATPVPPPPPAAPPAAPPTAPPPPAPVPPVPPHPAPAADPSAPQVPGTLCSRGHFNDPDAAYCTVCGISMQQQTAKRVLGTRPALGVLVLDDGQAIPLAGDVVLGREPAGHPAVAAGEATAFTLNDDVDGVSRVHARVVLSGWTVCLADLGSANGTYLVDGTQSRPVHAGQPVTLTDGTVLRLGRRTLTFFSYHSGGE